MSPELDKKLVTKYPKIFANRYGDMRNTCMCWGFECDNGWYNIIDCLCSNLQWNTDQNNRPDKNGNYPYPQIVASQVKEKYGTLRFYVEGATAEQHAVISFVETLSAHVCENCGSMKNIGSTQGWYKTLCEECHNPESNWKLNTEDNEGEDIKTT